MVAVNQFQYNGLLMGASTVYRVIKVDGIPSLPSARVSEDSRPQAHGSRVFADFMASRAVVLEGYIDRYRGLADEVAYVAAENALKQAFTVQDDDLPLSFYPFGDQAKRVNGKPTDLSIDGDKMWADKRLGHFVVQVLCEDPRIYDDALSTMQIVPSTPVGGIDFDVDFDVNFGGGSSVAGNATNNGIFSTLPVARIDGPATNPKVQNDNALGGAQFIQLNTNIADGDYILIDFDARTILLNGTASRYNTLTTDSVWWELQPGTSTIQFPVSGAGAHTKLTLTWRSAWV